MADSFENLIVWQKALDLMGCVYEETKRFPSDERFGLTSQMRRASCSVCANIAEGYGRVGRRDYIRCLGIARGSSYELKAQILMCDKVGYLEREALEPLCEEVIRMLSKLIVNLQASMTKEERVSYGEEVPVEALLDP